MKKQLFLFLLTLLPMVAMADAVEIDGIYYNLITKGYIAEVTEKPNYYSGAIVIPPSVTYEGNDYSVTAIGKTAFSGCSGLTSITIPNSVTTIGGSAFHYCSGLTSITIPNSVTIIDNWAFEYCSGLTSVTIPNSVKNIGQDAFSGCSSLSSVHISDLVAWCNIAFYNFHSNPLNLAQHLFLNGEEIKDLVIPNSVTSIGNSVFCGCSALTSVTIPNSVTSIGESAFYRCTGLTSITIGNNVTSIGNKAFWKCTNLTSITIPNNVTSIGKYTFAYCSGLTSITIGNSVTSIGECAFFDCNGLTSVLIGEGAHTINKKAFASCPKLTDVYCCAKNVPNTNTEAFDGSYIEYATLHVPAEALNAYKETAPWIGFKTIISIDGTIPEIKKCATPTISHVNGKLKFSCETEGVEYVSEVTVADAKKYYSSEVNLTATYNVSVYATKQGYENSDVATTTICWINDQELQNYLLSFVVDNKELKKQETEAGATITPPAKDSNGNTVSWYTYPTTMPAHDLVVYGMVPKPDAPEKYAITYLLDGITYKTVVMEEGATVSKETAPYKEGYTFSGWQDEPTTMPGNDVTVNGTFSVNSYSLSFIVDNKELGARSVEYGATITPPTKDSNGNTISWYTYPATMPAHDLVVYGIVPKPEAAAKYTITYMLDGQTYRTVVVEEGASVSKEKAPYKEGYTFNGWQNEPTTMPGRNVTVNGTFSVNTYRLSFVVDNEELSARNVTYGASVTAPTTDGEGNEITWYEYPTTMPAHDLVVYGIVVKQEPAKYTLSYLLDGEPYKSVVLEAGAEVVAETEPAKEGYTFSGWQNEPTTMPGNDVTVSGTFVINKYRLSFIAENRELSSQNVEYGSKITAPTTDDEGNTVTWYTYPSTMPAHDLVVYGIVVKEPEPEVFVWLTVNDCQSGYTKIKVKQGAEQTLNIAAEEGWKISNIFMDGRYVTARLAEDGTFVTPAITSDASIIIVYEETVPSGVRATRSQAVVKVVSDGVIISNAEPDSQCVVYSANGSQVVNTVVGEGTRKITLPQGQVYILTIDGRTLKFAL